MSETLRLSEAAQFMQVTPQTLRKLVPSRNTGRADWPPVAALPASN